MWKIGNVEINNRIVSAPMAGITNGRMRADMSGLSGKW